MGRRPLAASISPQKTWRGRSAARWWPLWLRDHRPLHLPWTLGEALLLGVVVSIVAPIGDLCESLIKRNSA